MLVGISNVEFVYAVMNEIPDIGHPLNPSVNNIHIEIYGTGKPVILVHGWAMHSGVWRDFAKKLGEKFQAICVDLPGHGRSDAVHPYNLQHIGDALLEAVPDDPCCWLGWSLGATVVLDIADRFPERVDTLILSSGNPRFVSDGDWPAMPVHVLEAFAGNLNKHYQSTLLRFQGLQVQGAPDSRTVLAKLKKMLTECDLPDKKILQGALNVLKNADLRTELTKIKIPVMLVLGDKDALVPVAVSDAVQELAPQAEVHVIEGAGHVPFLTHRREFAEIISNFINHNECRI